MTLSLSDLDELVERRYSNYEVAAIYALGRANGDINVARDIFLQMGGKEGGLNRVLRRMLRDGALTMPDCETIKPKGITMALRHQASGAYYTDTVGTPPREVNHSAASSAPRVRRQPSRWRAVVRTLFPAR